MVGSSADVGSSKRIIWGFIDRQRAIATIEKQIIFGLKKQKSLHF